MKTAVIFYSYSGKTRELAVKKAAELDAAIVEVTESKKRSVLSAYLLGTMAAMGQKKAKIDPVNADLSGYDKFVVAAPLWAGFPAPAFNSILALIPKGKEVDLIITSGSGNSEKSKAKTIALAEKKGFKVAGYQDVKTAK